MDDTYWMRLALAEAEKAAAEGEVPVGAVIVRGDSLLAACHNTREKTGNPAAHAEMLCMQKAAATLGGWRLQDCTLYVTLEPCPMCAGAMLMARLGRCVWGAADERLGCCGSVYDLPADPKLGGATRWTGHVLESACTAALQAFFSARRGSQDVG